MRTTFSSDEIAELKKNPCVFDATFKSVYYTREFKQRVLELQAGGVHAKEIWKRSGFDVTKWKDEYFRCTLRDWREIVQKHGAEGLTRSGGTLHDSGSCKNGTDTVKRLELQIKYLKSENDFLAQLRAKRAESNSGRVKNTPSLGD